MKKNLSEIIVIADRSGSMFGIIDEARNSINRFIEEQQEVKGEAKFTFVMFDEMYNKINDREDLKTVKPVGKEYSSRGMTALFDAIGKTINHITSELEKTKKKDKSKKVIVAIITDGMENSSHEFKKKDIAKMIKTQQEQYNWEFFFFGANIDAFAEGASLNIASTNTFSYDATTVGIATAYKCMSDNVTMSRSK